MVSQAAANCRCRIYSAFYFKANAARLSRFCCFPTKKAANTRVDFAVPGVYDKRYKLHPANAQTRTNSRAAPHTQRGPHFCCERPCATAPPTTAEQQGRTPAGPAGPLSPATRGAPPKGAQSGWNRGAFDRFIPHFLVWDEAFFLLSLRLLQSGKEVFLYDQSGSERQREGI